MGGAESNESGAGLDGQLWCGTNASTCCNRSSGAKHDITRGRPQAYPQFTDKSGPEGSQWYDGGAGMPESAAHVDGGGGGAYTEGEETYEDGTTYKGQLVGGKRHGVGTWTSDAEAYTGQWKEDQRDGQGRQTWKDGRVYEGQFKGGKLHGYGRMEWHMPNGLMVYEGQYVDDLKDGQGRYVWPDGRVYDGGWQKGMRHGRATVTTSKGLTRHEIWKEDKMERRLEAAP
mmetsp:Transcript_45655/g.132915  ORF Transcript_45655/g.132915 Transcript_45655/m.132915 type:complete len:229 (-) Transcript_45655:64-750(-)